MTSTRLHLIIRVFLYAQFARACLAGELCDAAWIHE